MKKMFLLGCLLWAAWQSFAQNVSCGLDTLRQIEKAKSDEQQWREDQFKFKVNDFRDNNTIILPPTPMPPSGGGGALVASDGCFKANYVIPVVVHIVYNGSDPVGTNANLKSELVRDQIRLLNEHYANYGNTTAGSVNTGIQFCLAPVGDSLNGIFRVSNSLTNTNPSDAEAAQMRTLVDETLYPLDQYLHIFVVTSLNKGGGKNYAGYASHPANQTQFGVVVRYQFFGDHSKFAVFDSRSDGKTLAHEVGHYFGLWHTFEGNCTGANASTCKIQGDWCCDTPPVDGEQFGCSADNTCHNDTPDLSDMITNHMAYNSDACRNMFTRDQVNSMYYYLLNVRYNLIDVNHLNDLGLPCCVNSAMFSGDINYHCSGGTTILTALHYSSTTKYRWVITKSSTTIRDVTFTGKDTLHFVVNSLGDYTVKLYVIEGTDTFTNEKANYITVANCGSPIASEQGTWHFGHYGGITFNSGGTNPNFKAVFGGSRTGPSIFSSETAVTQCRSDGKLLFLAGADVKQDSLRIWNQFHNKMGKTEHIALKGSDNGVSGLAIIPQTTDGKRFLLISIADNEDTGFLYYRVIDTSLNGNLGDILGRMNIPVTVPSGCLADDSGAVQVRESIIGSTGCDGTYYWLIAVDGGRKNTNANDSSFLVFKVQGYNITFSHAVKIHGAFNQFSRLKLSPDGTKLAYGTSLFNFNKKTGNITPYRDFTGDLDGIYTSVYGSNMALKANFDKYRKTLYAVSFSPDSRKLYFVRSYFNIPGAGEADTIIQFDLDKAEPENFQRVIGTYPPGFFTGMQLGPDNKIHMVRKADTKLAVISNPDNLNTDLAPNSCGYNYNGSAIGGVATYFLPNFIDTKKESTITYKIYFTIRNCTEYYFETSACCASSYLWKFGDGTTDTGRFPIHTYASEGNYTVKLFYDGDSITLNIQVGLMTTTISGRTIGCDTSQPSEYNAIPRNSEFSYTWKTVGGNLLSPNPIQDMPISWNTSGKVMVEVKNKVTGCYARDTMNVTKQAPITSNSILTMDTVFCQSDSFLITGFTPAGGAGSGYTYGWYKSTNGIDWVPLFGPNTKDLYGKLPNTYYYREVSSNGCISKSNKSDRAHYYFTNNTIIQTKSVCLKGAKAKFTGYGIVKGGYPYYYQWQYSTDSSSWTIDSNGYTGTDTAHLNHYSKIINSKLYVRRVLIASSCTLVSNVITINRPTEIKKHPINTYVCSTSISSGPTFRMWLELYKFNGSAVTFLWQYQNSSGNWAPMSASFTPDSSITSPNTGYTISGSSTIVRCLLIACGDSIPTNNAILSFVNTVASFSQYPTDVFASPPSQARFVAKSNNANIFWQKSTDQGKTWVVIPDANDSVLLEDIEYYCDAGVSFPPPFTYNRTLYRVQINNGCNNFYSYQVTAYDKAKQVVVRDDFADKGKEPSDTFITTGRLIRNPMVSPDIAVEYASGINPFTTNDTAKYVLSDSNNYVWVRVRNRGTTTSLATTMDLHWSIASSGLQWTKNWMSIPSNRFLNQSASVIGTYYYWGGKINASPITVPALSAGQTAYISYLWSRGSVPKSENYYKSVKINAGAFQFYIWKQFPRTQSICLLARMPECTFNGCGMTYRESQNTSENVRRNNKIAAKARVLTYASPPPYTTISLSGHPIVIRDAKDSAPSTLKVGISANDSLLTNVVDMVVTLDSIMEQQWTAGGSAGYGFVPLATPNRVLVTDIKNFRLENITLDTLQEGAIWVDFYKKSVPTGPGTLDYTLDVWQMSDRDSMPEGFVQIVVTAPQYLTGGGDEGGGGHEGGGGNPNGETFQIPNGFKEPGFNLPSLGKLKLHSGKTGGGLADVLTAYPNPTSNTLTVEWTATSTSPFVITVTSLLGEIVYTAEVTQTAEGEYKYTIPFASFANGIYTVQVASENFNGTAKVVLIK